MNAKDFKNGDYVMLTKRGRKAMEVAGHSWIKYLDGVLLVTYVFDHGTKPFCHVACSGFYPDSGWFVEHDWIRRITWKEQCLPKPAVALPQENI